MGFTIFYKAGTCNNPRGQHDAHTCMLSVHVKLQTHIVLVTLVRNRGRSSYYLSVLLNRYHTDNIKLHTKLKRNRKHKWREGKEKRPRTAQNNHTQWNKLSTELETKTKKTVKKKVKKGIRWRKIILKKTEKKTEKRHRLERDTD